jgi:hypothetical protein
VGDVKWQRTHLENTYTYELQSGIHTSLLFLPENAIKPYKRQAVLKIQQNIDVGLITVTCPVLTQLNHRPNWIWIYHVSCSSGLCTIYIFERQTIILKHTRENYICDFISSSLKSRKHRLWQTDRQTRYSYMRSHCFHPEFTCNFRAPLSPSFLWDTVSEN